ncbi:NAD(P)-dependent oxidoreductase [Termitidicoccus mucosus]|uniref:NAD-dependent epimerase/dehydratase domain-containing protein n=1 Tax=Termitidicoccus mucosus TaxID=1184151 RepID=A0A178IC63_9BACT|nr:hypothetical protein AW736_22170 [Opitutaceae bacterium TSB47]
MKIAIIGSNGFVGTRLVEHLHLDSPHTAVPIVRQPSSLALPARFAIDWRLADALDSDSLAAALHGCDAVVHAALGDPDQITRMPAVLCAAAARAGLRRIVYLSSASVHGQDIPPGTDEETPLHTRHSLDYNNAKVRAERALFAAARRHSLHVYALRPGVVFGPRSRWITDAAQALRDGVAWLHGDGSGICNTIYIDNLVHAIRLCLEHSDPAATATRAYLVADAETVTWADFHAPVARALEVPAEAIHRVEHLPAFPKSFRQRVDQTLSRPWAQKLLPAFPHKLKQNTKKILATLSTPPPPDAWTIPAAPRPVITEEQALLQQCRWKIPHARATGLLAYHPPVTFAEGMARSLAWLSFARPDLFPEKVTSIK